MSKWLNYNISQQTYVPKTVNDVITNKYDDIHKEMYETSKKLAIINAVNKYGEYLFDHKDIKELSENIGNYIFLTSNNGVLIECDNIEDAKYYIDLDDYKISEIIVSNNYLMPSKILVTQRGIIKSERDIKINRFEIDLTDYWNNNYELLNEFRDPDDLLTNNLDDWYKYNDIINYDYINGKALLENRVEMKKRKIDFKSISTDDEIKIDYQLD